VLTDFVLECGDDDRAIDFIASWLADGGSMRDLCERYGLKWGVLAAWVRKDARRNALFEQAMADRKMYFKEKLMDGWWRTEGEPIPDGVATHGDIHKARESIAKTLGMYSEGVQVGASVTVVLDKLDRAA
jgi:hypothetical protein